MKKDNSKKCGTDNIAKCEDESIYCYDANRSVRSTIKLSTCRKCLCFNCNLAKCPPSQSEPSA